MIRENSRKLNYINFIKWTFLVETFKAHFTHTFNYEGKRAIVFKLDAFIKKFSG